MLTQRRQQQAICDLIYGNTPEITPKQLRDPYDFLWGFVEAVHGDRYDVQQELHQLKLREDDIAHIIDEILAMKPGQQQSYQTLTEIGPGLPDVNWLWENWIPKGLLTILAAWPGVGKTYVALDFARRIIGQMTAPDHGHLATNTGNVIYVDAEDFLPIVHLRAGVWQMNTDKFYPLRRAPRDLIDMTSSYYQDMLVDMCYDLKPDLVIVDSLSSVNSKGENSIEDLRDLLTFFVELPQAFDMALVLVHHLRKPGKNGNGGAITMHDLRGSGHLVAMARSIIGLDVIDADDPNAPRIMKIIKTNLCMYPKPLSVRFQPTENPAVANLIYGSGDLVHLPETLTGECAQWLVQVLEDGAKSYQELKDFEKYNETTIQRARQMLNGKVTDTLGPRQAGNKWTLSPTDHLKVKVVHGFGV